MQAKSPIAGILPIKVPITVHSFTGISTPVAKVVKLIMINDSIVMGGNSGGGSSGSGGTTTTRTNKISTIESLMKKTCWIWGGNKTTTELANLFGSIYRCPKKSDILSNAFWRVFVSVI